MTAERITTVAANGPPPSSPGMLYPGDVMHARLRPFGHRFVYSVFSLLADLDQLAALGRMSRLLSVNRPGLVSFWEADHVERPGETLRQFVDRHLAQAGLEQPAARVLVLAYPRILGYAFNPIAVYFAYDASDRLVALIYAVRNTFGQRHSYVARLLPGELTDAGVRQERTKIFHVSPFIDMGMRYHFRVLPPGRTVKLRIHETDAEGPLLSATFNGTAVTLNDANLAGLLLRFPLMTMKVMAAIHWEALKLWWKGAPFRTSPPAPAPASYADTAPARPTVHVPEEHAA